MKQQSFPEPRITEREAISIIGMHITMSRAQDKTQQLWQSFGPRKKEVLNTVDLGNYSVQVYDKDFMTTPFLPTTHFVKWAGVAVNATTSIPENLELLEIPAGLWAVFTYKGEAKDFGNLVQYVMTQWLPASGYQLDGRPQFEYIEQSYRGPKSPDSEEEFWVPIVD